MDHGSLARPPHHPPNLCAAPHEMSSPNEKVTQVTSLLPDPDSSAAASPFEALPLNLQNGETVGHLPCAGDGNGNTRTATSSISNQALEVDSGGPPSSDGESHRDTARSPNAGSPSSSAVSQRSHVFDFVVEQGRTFHRYREGKYPLPNDNREQERLDFQHYFMLVLLDGKLQLAPIGENPQNVLDIGTGTGIWAIEFADRYPSANVIGTDLSPIQPDFVPKNCFFEIDDAEDEWLFTERFDYIHMRGMMTCFADPRSIIQKAYDQLAPGGYLEMQDGRFPLQCHDDTLQGTALDRWAKACVEAGKANGRAWNNARFYKQWMEEIGFEVVKEKIFEVPTSNWPRGKKAKELGLWFHEDLMDALSGSKVLLTKTLDYQQDEVELLLMEVRKNLKDRGVHAYMPLYITYGRKPMGDVPHHIHAGSQQHEVEVSPQNPVMNGSTDTETISAY
ncbi:S-adenosyl-L-methionine-dependent methyltransferase [Hyaloscypha hepaticicola]|uniref:S-adenosyl-L-methionine-dependent methyltransferase n=1 Tax=Hyaloscypha hepaticicola TaxID=2082293 RepID=A0A2J6PP07_9HELO|nr:S-adenosyl-L-methionine-dependent methyltransferase [Hyaloscypha hepaticicola]